MPFFEIVADLNNVEVEMKQLLPFFVLPTICLALSAYYFHQDPLATQEDATIQLEQLGFDDSSLEADLTDAFQISDSSDEPTIQAKSADLERTNKELSISPFEDKAPDFSRQPKKQDERKKKDLI